MVRPGPRCSEYRLYQNEGVWLVFMLIECPTLPISYCSTIRPVVRGAHFLHRENEHTLTFVVRSEVPGVRRQSHQLQNRSTYRLDDTMTSCIHTSYRYYVLKESIVLSLVPNQYWSTLHSGMHRKMNLK